MALRTMYALPHATTSTERITSPMILIPGHEPLSTTLNMFQLTELLPTLHMYIDASLPSLALLPATGISFTGLKAALRWREAELECPGDETISTLSEIVQIYQSLAFLGNNSNGRTLQALTRMIQAEIDQGMSLEGYHDLWALRHLPFTELFIKAMIVRLVHVATDITEVVARPDFQTTVNENERLRRHVEGTLNILKWIYEEDDLKRRVERMSMTLQKEEARKAAKRMDRYSGVSAVRKFEVKLDTVIE